jgi:hypothetical protein
MPTFWSDQRHVVILRTIAGDFCITGEVRHATQSDLVRTNDSPRVILYGIRNKEYANEVLVSATLNPKLINVITIGHERQDYVGRFLAIIAE